MLEVCSRKVRVDLDGSIGFAVRVKLISQSVGFRIEGVHGSQVDYAICRS